MVLLGKLVYVPTIDPSQEDIMPSRFSARVRYAGIEPVQTFLFAHTPTVVLYDCR